MAKSCKLCGRPIEAIYTIYNVTYYHCPACNFLQNFHWEETPALSASQVAANDYTRERLWPAGEREHMRQKGWEMLELMTSKSAWFSRKVHGLLKKLPGYKEKVETEAKQKLPRLLDFGCGHGITVLELAKEGFDIVGVDPFSPTQDPRILRQDLQASNFPDASFDGIFTIETMEHIPNVLDIYGELHRILKPNGTLLVQTRRLEDPAYQRDRKAWFYLQEPETHVSIYSEQAMKHIAEKVGFADVAFRGVKFARFIK
jgi:2-polyprenyl-3-methyl-5-hydroxy-6-metoxy-1,4-benzoquinol methylase